ncbi:MAG: 30S ribosomal protein S9 [Candidatus Actinomarina sp.]|nr:30S ribosomal protein S9 [Candidatus Actinomarina sp.]MBL6762514.1 30S ribosomal protein S9 [Candidatus Actinomarina sp.]MBL6835641.1 30S ribosomal protein S9 [Candidatus Actinomarina sp.]
MKKMPDNFYGTGRRKSSVARVTITEGNGKFTFNGKDLAQYFPSPSMKMTIEKPFKVVSLEGKFDMVVNVSGSGLSAQSDAVALGISRALIKMDPELRPKLKKAGLLTRDARKVERKKYGLKKARRAEQFTKR